MTVEVYQAVLNLRGNPDFDVFMRHVGALEAASTERLVNAPKEEAQLHQGFVRAYKGLSKLREDAPTAVARAKTPDRAR